MKKTIVLCACVFCLAASVFTISVMLPSLKNYIGLVRMYVEERGGIPPEREMYFSDLAKTTITPVISSLISALFSILIFFLSIVRPKKKMQELEEKLQKESTE